MQPEPASRSQKQPVVLLDYTHNIQGPEAEGRPPQTTTTEDTPPKEAAVQAWGRGHHTQGCTTDMQTGSTFLTITKLGN